MIYDGNRGNFVADDIDKSGSVADFDWQQVYHNLDGEEPEEPTTGERLVEVLSWIVPKVPRGVAELAAVGARACQVADLCGVEAAQTERARRLARECGRVPVNASVASPAQVTHGARQTYSSPAELGASREAHRASQDEALATGSPQGAATRRTRTGGKKNRYAVAAQSNQITLE